MTRIVATPLSWLLLCLVVPPFLGDFYVGLIDYVMISSIIVVGIVLLTGIIGMVSFVLARFVRTFPLAILATAVIADVLFVLYFVFRFTFSQQVHEHGSEELVLLPIIFVVVTAPAVVLSSIGFGRLASRFYQRKSTEFNHESLEPL